MKPINRQLLLALLLLLTVISCKKDKDKIDPDPDPASDFVLKDAQVVLPAGSSYDLTDSRIMTFAESFPVSKDGKTKAIVLPKTEHIAYLFDKDGNPVMAGFITDSTSTISVATTAKVLIYHAYGVAFRPDTLTDIFINRADELKGMQQWVDEFTNLWKNDPLVLSKGAFTAGLRTAMERMVTNRNPVDVGSKTSSLSVDNGDFLSGIQIFEDGIGQLSFHNNYRRRAHAFLYKMKYKDLNGNPHNVLSSIESGTAATKDLSVDAAAANTSITGQLGTMIEGNADEFFMKKSGPVALDLGENESEATYKVRVVGPGVPYSKQPTTTAEIKKQNRLEVETFAIDFVFPLIMEVYGWKDDLAKKGIDIGTGPVENFIEKTELLLKALPDVYAEISGGNYKQAFLKMCTALYSGAVDKMMTDLMTAGAAVGYELLSKAGANIPALDFNAIAGKAKSAAFILKIVNAAMLGGDFLKILYGLTNSHQLEEWEVLARKSQVSLLPAESKVIPLAQQKITAEIKDVQETGDTHPFFEWSTSGKYGYLKDTKGHQGNAFGSQDKDVFYNCNAKAADLTDGDNWEYVYVKAMIGSKVIGTDTAKINVRKFKYKMLPNGITLSGKEGAHNEVRLYLERADGVVDIKANDHIDYKVVWTTAGQHGGLSAKDIDNAKTVTEYDENSTWYSCLDDKTKESKETVKARIYSKTKDETEYSLFDEVTGTININNDEKKKIIHVPMTYHKGCWEEGNCYIYPVAIFKVEDSAKKYSVKFYNFTGTSANPPEGQTYTWNKGQKPPTYYSVNGPTQDIIGGSYYVSLGRTWCDGSPAGCNLGNAATWEANYRRLYGSRVMAEVTYFY